LYSLDSTWHTTSAVVLTTTELSKAVRSVFKFEFRATTGELGARFIAVGLSDVAASTPTKSGVPAVGGGSRKDRRRMSGTIMYKEAATAAITLEDAIAEIRRLSTLVEASKLINSSIEGEVLFRSIMRVVREHLGVDRGTLYVYDAKRNEIRASIDPEPGLSEIRLAVGQGLAGTAAETGRSIIINDAYADPRFDDTADRLSGFRTRSVLCSPIRNRERQLVGVLQLLNKQGGDFGTADLQFLESLSDHMAIAIENARYHALLVRQNRIERDLQLARDIQSTLLGVPPPAVPELDIVARWQTCYEVGGDYYDFLSLGDGTFGFTIGDVSGKGVAAALVMSFVQAALRVASRVQSDLPLLCQELNATLHGMTGGRKYATLFLARYDATRGEVTYVNAGHNRPLLRDATGVRTLKSTGVPVGMFPRAQYKSETVAFHRGATLVLYTDGLTEAADENDEEFGAKRLADIVASASGNAAQLAGRIFTAVGDHELAAVSSDDKTLVVIRRN
jgi:phosphoserine phosphatase RsbU/P